MYSQTIKLNAFGEVVEVIDGENNTIKYEYDSLGRQIAVYDGYSKPTKYEYTSRGRKTTVIDGNENKYQNSFDEFGFGGEVMIGKIE